MQTNGFSVKLSGPVTESSRTRWFGLRSFAASIDPMGEHEEAPQALCGDLCWLLSRASHTLTAELTGALQNMKLSPRTHRVLVTAMSGEYTQIELARLVGLDKTTMVVTLDELEAAGLAERRPSKVDRRARVVAVTPAGKRKVKQAAAILDRIREDVLASLPADEREVFVGSLRTLVNARLAVPAPATQPVRRRAPRAPATVT